MVILGNSPNTALIAGDDKKYDIRLLSIWKYADRSVLHYSFIARGR